MFNAPTNTSTSSILKSGAMIAVAVVLSLVMVSDQRPRQIDIGEDAVLSVGLRLNQYAPVTQLPAWLQLPGRSTAVYGSVLADADSNRVYFRSLSSGRTIERHFRKLFLANGYQLAFVRPSVSGSGISSLIMAFDTEAARSVQVTVREGRAARLVEISFREPARVASKGLLIGS